MREFMTIVENAEVLTEGTYEVFHGTDADFKRFEPKSLGSANGTAPINMTGFNFTDNPDVAKTFGRKVLRVTVTMNKPYVTNAKGMSYSEFKHVLNDRLDRLKRENYDGVIIKNYVDGGKYGEEMVSNHYIPFDISQIKIHK